ncbi:two-component response subfamily [Leptolyngbya sp. Heron Island J]|uniref:response regulator transcription factor n=1 Tax=Leptolyngbya sp. Heron Island J TaxID=1385935 RepID=UPI0003B9CEC8|nr:helix-turn-helix transcriptional regulator [Leptolyngbya sp. Heron Island J]ESA38289.1 two-component response subfamily [Leptolyngbya sp. Heron Island J]
MNSVTASKIEKLSLFGSDLLTNALVNFKLFELSLYIVSYNDLKQVLNKTEGSSITGLLSEPTNKVVGKITIDGQDFMVVLGKDISAPVSSKITHQGDMLHVLTGRELEIAILVASGCSNKLIAKKLGISSWTVSSHLRRIYSKLSIENRAALACRCAALVTSQNL